MNLDALWDFDRPAVSEERFQAALGIATDEDALILRTQLARALGLQQRFDEAAAELATVEAVGDLPPLARTYLHLERGRLLNSGGKPDEAKPEFLRALEEAEAAKLDYQAADAAHMLAIVEPGEAQIGWAQRALAIAEASDDSRARRWVGSVTHNLGWTLHDLGRHEEALALFERALAFREEQYRAQQGDAEAVRVGRWTVARGLRSVGRFEEALAIQRELEDTGPEDGYVSEEIAELLFALGREQDARPHFARAHALLAADALLAESDPGRLHRLAVLGAKGGGRGGVGEPGAL